MTDPRYTVWVGWVWNSWAEAGVKQCEYSPRQWLTVLTATSADPQGFIRPSEVQCVHQEVGKTYNCQLDGPSPNPSPSVGEGMAGGGSECVHTVLSSDWR